nr:MAG TPA: hypothetical protein [Caudoviricetes sp.]
MDSGRYSVEIGVYMLIFLLDFYYWVWRKAL